MYKNHRKSKSYTDVININRKSICSHISTFIVDFLSILRLNIQPLHNLISRIGYDILYIRLRTNQIQTVSYDSNQQRTA